MEYAVVRTGGKQYRVSPGDLVEVERFPAERGATVELGEVLLTSTGGTVRVGTPIVAGARVTAKVVEHTRGKKILVFKMKRRKNERRKRGHRQDITTMRVLEIVG
jgi:large subunit ribosomal protein L21